MVMEELVQSVDKELAALEDECKANRENPRLLKLIEQMRRLTNVNSDGSEKAPAKSETESLDIDAPAQNQAVKNTPANCPHKAVNIYGQCLGCGKCQHTQTRNGICNTCGATVSD